MRVDLLYAEVRAEAGFKSLKGVLIRSQTFDSQRWIWLKGYGFKIRRALLDVIHRLLAADNTVEEPLQSVWTDI